MLSFLLLVGCAQSGGQRWIAEITASAYLDEPVADDVGAAVELWTSASADGVPFVGVRAPEWVATGFEMSGTATEADGAYPLGEGSLSFTQERDRINGTFRVLDVAWVTFEGVLVADLPVQDAGGPDGQWIHAGGIDTLVTAGETATWLPWSGCRATGTLDGAGFHGEGDGCDAVDINFDAGSGTERWEGGEATFGLTRLAGLLEGW